ncbi:hypothetical protein STAS_14528 [Striga asiatica]|uniref:Secreted protein n=1 Tax=Striga asiatica TaxID=4170 RepID=A0A5A7PYZ4_STRAF|nr:hypothetical protein STAS_14528 [Striga asiatica]
MWRSVIGLWGLQLAFVEAACRGCCYPVGLPMVEGERHCFEYLPNDRGSHVSNPFKCSKLFEAHHKWVKEAAVAGPSGHSMQDQSLVSRVVDPVELPWAQIECRWGLKKSVETENSFAAGIGTCQQEQAHSVVKQWGSSAEVGSRGQEPESFPWAN